MSCRYVRGNKLQDLITTYLGAIVTGQFFMPQLKSENQTKIISEKVLDAKLSEAFQLDKPKKKALKQ